MQYKPNIHFAMDNNPGVPGLLLMAISYILGMMHIVERSDVTFWLGLIASVLASIYYIKLIFFTKRKEQA